MHIPRRTSNTFTQSVNTVDTLFAALPAFLYLNPELAGYLLEPLLKYQDSPAYTQNFAAKNIGKHYITFVNNIIFSFEPTGSTYPNATADSINEDHPYGVEGRASLKNLLCAKVDLTPETSNMLIMILAYSQLSGNNTLINNHYGLLQKWGQYLSNNSLTPLGQ